MGDTVLCTDRPSAEPVPESVCEALPLGLCGAVFAVALELPARTPGGSEHVLVQVRSVDSPLQYRWAGGADTLIALGDEPTWACPEFSNLSDGIGASTDLYVRVRFCEDEYCLSLGDPVGGEVALRVERPLVEGTRTYVRLRIDAPPGRECAGDPICGGDPCYDNGCACRSAADCADTFGEARCEPVPDEAGGVCAQTIERCRVEGCIEGPASSSFCSLSGEHFCDRSGQIRDLPIGCGTE